MELNVERMATGGEAVGRLPDGRVMFVRGALAGERVAVRIDEEKKRFARGSVVEILEASPDRVAAPCPHAADGSCGGCDWQHIEASAQRSYKQGIVIEQLQRLGGLEAPDVSLRTSPRGYRTTVRCKVVDGAAGYVSRGTTDVFNATACGAAHELLRELIVDADFGDATEVTLRAGAATGDRMVISDGSVKSVRVPGDVVVVASNNVGNASINERAAGRLWRVSANSFFQTSSTGAELLVDAVRDGLSDSSGELVDLYGGVGLLGGGAAPEHLTCVVEQSSSSCADAEHNLGACVEVVQSQVERWSPRPFSTVIADPARRGLAKAGVAIIDKTDAHRLVLVSCDPASLGRDTALLVEQGWRYDRGEVIDMFPDTSRIEVVSTLSR